MLGVHLGGYLNVLDAALPLMAAAGHGSILGVTSGSGWRAADAGAYSCAKRAIAALTWQLGRQAPPGVTINAMSPIAATRMVAAAIERARREGKASGGGGLSLESVPRPEDLGPFGAYLVDDRFRWCSGRVLFAGGSEVAVVEEPRLLEVVRSDDVVSLARVLGAVVPRAFAAAEASQVSGGGGNPRFGPIFEEPGPAEAPSAHVRTCVVVTDRPRLAASLTAALESRSIACHRAEVAHGFGDAANALSSVVDAVGPIDAIVVAPEGRQPTATSSGRVGAGARRAPRDHRPHLHRRRMGPGGRRLRIQRRPPGPAGDPHRRRHREEVGVEPRPRRSSRELPRVRRKGASQLSLRASRLRRWRLPNRSVNSSPTCSVTPRQRLSPVRSW